MDDYYQRTDPIEAKVENSENYLGFCATNKTPSERSNYYSYNTLEDFPNNEQAILKNKSDTRPRRVMKRVSEKTISRAAKAYSRLRSPSVSLTADTRASINKMDTYYQEVDPIQAKVENSKHYLEFDERGTESEPHYNTFDDYESNEKSIREEKVQVRPNRIMTRVSQKIQAAVLRSTSRRSYSKATSTTGTYSPSLLLRNPSSSVGGDIPQPSIEKTPQLESPFREMGLKLSPPSTRQVGSPPTKKRRITPPTNSFFTTTQNTMMEPPSSLVVEERPEDEDVAKTLMSLSRISPPAQSPPRIRIPSNTPPLSSEVLRASSQSPRPTISGRQATPPQRHSPFSPNGEFLPEDQAASPNSRQSVQPQKSSDPNAPNASMNDLDLNEKRAALNSFMEATTGSWAADCKQKGFPPGAKKRVSGQSLQAYSNRHGQIPLLQELFKKHPNTNVARKYNPYWVGNKTLQIQTTSPSPQPAGTTERSSVSPSPNRNRLGTLGTFQSLPPDDMLTVPSSNTHKTPRRSTTPDTSPSPQTLRNPEKSRSSGSPSPSVQGTQRRSATPQTRKTGKKWSQAFADVINKLESELKRSVIEGLLKDRNAAQGRKPLLQQECDKKLYGGFLGKNINNYILYCPDAADDEVVKAAFKKYPYTLISKPKNAEF